MVSSYYVTIRLDRHYQQFLRHQFRCDNAIFEFPAKHKFNVMLEHYVMEAPADYEDPDWGEETFKIALPNFEFKNVSKFRYLSKFREDLFKQKIKGYHDWLIEEFIRKAMKDNKRDDMFPKDRQGCTIYLIQEFGLSDENKDSYDRIYRAITRVNQREYTRRYRDDLKKKNKAKSHC